MKSLWKKWFGSSIAATESTTEDNNMKKFLIVGLGNPGAKYSETRHNIGFKVLDQLAADKEVSFETLKLGDVATTTHKGKKVILLKPNTFMNLSGKAIKYYLKQENISKEELLVVTDDLNLEFGTIRMKGKGSDGGHNGLKDTQVQLNTPNYPRLRFGISDAFASGRQVDYVLGEWDKEELKSLQERIETAASAALAFTHGGLANAMNEFNGK
jgi:PTH1 family peptidyl-tRNA hydrolase